MGDVSKEFCGGTHVANTGDLGVFRIVSEESVGSGVRRITCETKMKAYESFKQEENYLNETASLLKMKKREGLQERIEKLLEENAELKKQVNEAEQKAMAAEAGSMKDKAEEINGIQVLLLRLKDKDSKGLKEYAETLRNQLKDGLVFVSNEANGRITFVCASSKAAIAKGYKAGDIAKAAAQACGGNGGGRPDMAQAGGRDLSKIDDAFAAVRAILK
jgi:alanyl-tRNA synthetase